MLWLEYPHLSDATPVLGDLCGADLFAAGHSWFCRSNDRLPQQRPCVCLLCRFSSFGKPPFCFLKTGAFSVCRGVGVCRLLEFQSGERSCSWHGPEPCEGGGRGGARKTDGKSVLGKRGEKNTFCRDGRGNKLFIILVHIVWGFGVLTEDEIVFHERGMYTYIYIFYTVIQWEKEDLNLFCP